MTRHSAPRRAFLRSTSAVVALPFLESLGWSRFASAANKTATPPKRMVFLSFGWGVTEETWFPDQGQTGSDYELPKGLQPLARHKDDLTIIQNLANQFSTEAHWGSTFYLTGANRYGKPGQGFHNSISADQVAAEEFGKETRFTSLQLGCDRPNDSGHGPGLSLAWSRQGKPLAGQNDPVKAYHKLFADDNASLAERQMMLRQKRSVLDTVMEDARTVKRGLSQLDADKLSEYLQSIRDIETRLVKEEQWLEVPKVKPEKLVEPGDDVNGYDEVKVMYDIIVAALKVDATRVITYRQPVESLIKSLGATISGHNMSHYAGSNSARREVSQMRDDKQSELLAYLIDQLKASKEPDGSSLYDHVVLSYGSNINTSHNLRNCPAIVTGGGAGIQHGKHHVVPEETPLCNLWLSLLQGVGLDVQSHGDSSGTISQLFG